MISKNLPWGAEIEMMPGKRCMFKASKKKSYDGIFLGWKDPKTIFVVRAGNSTKMDWHPAFWRVKND